jgi:uncharacterized protein
LNPDATLSPPEASVPQPSAFRKVFVGKEGMRAGWSALVFILIFAAFMGAAVFITLRFVPGSQRAKNIQELSLKFAYFNEGLGSLGVLLATWIMSRIERRGRTYGYGSFHKLKYLLAGMVWGLVLISLLVFLLWKDGLLAVDGRLLFGSDALRYGSLWLVAFGLVGLFEESLTRGFYCTR